MFSIKWLLIIFVLSQVFLYAARVPMHRALRNIGQSLSGGFRLAARWFKGIASDLSTRSQELVLEGGREHIENKIEQEFHRLETTFAKDLADFPRLHRKLDELASKIETDYKECAETPPSPPGWTEAVAAVTKMPNTEDKVVKKVMEEFHKSAVNGEKKALEEYRKSSSRRHKILSGMQPPLKEMKKVMEDAARNTKRALEATTRIDGYMSTYEQIRNQEDKAQRVQAWSAVNSFVIATLVMAVAVGGAFINFQLISLPMSELVPASSRLMGVSVASVAALVLVLMEIAAGIFMMEMLGITNLFPQLVGLQTSKKRLILSLALFGLFLLAGIESSLAILREQIVEAESALKQSLSGTEAGAAQPVNSMIPLIGQAVLGFILPWILAMVAIPLETMIRNAGPVGLMLLSLVVMGVGYVFRLVAAMVRYVFLAVRYLYDVYIIVPLQLERVLRGKQMVSVVTGGPALANPTEQGRK